MRSNQIIIMLKFKKNKSEKTVFVCIHFLKIYIENVMIFKIRLKFFLIVLKNKIVFKTKNSIFNLLFENVISPFFSLFISSGFLLYSNIIIS